VFALAKEAFSFHSRQSSAAFPVETKRPQAVQLNVVIPWYMVHEKFEWSFEWLPNSRISGISMGNRL
jgi:hypothetical protein